MSRSVPFVYITRTTADVLVAPIRETSRREAFASMTITAQEPVGLSGRVMVTYPLASVVPPAVIWLVQSHSNTNFGQCWHFIVLLYD